MNISFTGRETMLTPKTAKKAVDFFAETTPLELKKVTTKLTEAATKTRLASAAEESYIASHGVINETKAPAQIINYFG